MYDAPTMWDDMHITYTFNERYSFSMALSRVHIGLTSQQVKILDKLARKLGLDRTNTVRYCLMRVAEQEAVGPGGASRVRVEPE